MAPQARLEDLPRLEDHPALVVEAELGDPLVPGEPLGPRDFPGVEVARQDGLASSVVSKAGAGGPTLMLNGHVDRAWRFYNATAWAIFAIRDNGRVALQRMDNVGIVVESLDAAISFSSSWASNSKGEP